jgi:hypothetical protein
VMFGVVSASDYAHRRASHAQAVTRKASSATSRSPDLSSVPLEPKIVSLTLLIGEMPWKRRSPSSVE